MKITLIAAVGKNNEIGKKGALPWYIPEDLQRFKKLTLGKPIVMGRKTHESIGKALPGRRNIVLTRVPFYEKQGIEVVHSKEEALKVIQGSDEVFIIGGGSIYELFADDATNLELTLVENSIDDADVFFPELDMSQWVETAREDHDEYSFVTYAKT